VPIEVVLVTDTLGATEAAYGTVLALWGGGAVAGSALLPALRRVPLRTLLGGSFAVCAMSYLGMAAPARPSCGACSRSWGPVQRGRGLRHHDRRPGADLGRSAGSRGRLRRVDRGRRHGVGFLARGAVATLASARAVYLAAGLGILAVTALLLAPLRTPSGVSALLRALPRGALRVAAIATCAG
jgi:hypothetical protein